jgi:hypothetical protein
MPKIDNGSDVQPFALQTVPSGGTDDERPPPGPSRPTGSDHSNRPSQAGSSQIRPQSTTPPFSAETVLQIDRAFNPIDNHDSTIQASIAPGQALDLNAVLSAQSKTGNRTNNGDLGSIEMPTSGDTLQAGFLILMPERDMTTRQSRQMQLPEDERSHAPMEFGIWTGPVEGVPPKSSR